jgi:hypothetical protein
VTAYPTGATADFTQANEVLNTLRILPLPPATTAVPTTPSPTTVIAPTTAAPFVPSTADEQAIRDLFVSWQNGSNTDDDIRAIVEDADALLEFIHQGMAQHSAEDLAKYSGQVDAVRMIDAQHASVDYTLLWNGTPQFGRRTGTAVRIDGVWKVSRDTECALLALGNITCPPRSSP